MSQTLNTENPEDMASFLSEKGWKPWYNDDYWVNPKCVTDNTRQDYTMYGMSMQEAYRCEMEGIRPIPLPEYHFRGIAIR